MEILDKVLDYANGVWGEDSYFFNKNFVGVIDGSTPIEKTSYLSYQTQAEWFSENLSIFLSQTSIDDLITACKEYILKTQKLEFIQNLSFQNKPNAVIAGIQLKTEKLQLLCLGDCSIEVLLKDKSRINFSDKRIRKFSNKTKKARLNAIEKGLNSEVEVNKQLIENKKQMNKIGGYWTLAYKGAFENEFFMREIEVDKIDKILIYSDGFEEYFNFNNTIISKVIEQEISLQECVFDLRNIESKLKKRKNIKKHDDATAILIGF